MWIDDLNGPQEAAKPMREERVFCGLTFVSTDGKSLRCGGGFASSGISLYPQNTARVGASAHTTIGRGTVSAYGLGETPEDAIADAERSLRVVASAEAIAAYDAWKASAMADATKDAD